MIGRMLRAQRRRVTAMAAFALLALVAELTGRSITIRLDAAFQIAPLATPSTPYYPFVLAGVKILAGFAAAALVWRVIRAHLAVTAGNRLLATIGQRRASHVPRPRLRLSPKLWLASYAATSLWYLLQNDGRRVLTEGRWPVLAPWLHTYALMVFAVLAIVLALGWGAVRDWLADVEEYAAATVAFVRRFLHVVAVSLSLHASDDDHGPRRLFGLSFESRPPPLTA
jgi:hypothetical protein